MATESLDFLKFSISPYLSLIQSELNKFFLTPDERTHFYFEFLVDSLLRMDTLSRFKAYDIARSAGWLNADEIRRKENENPMPDDLGKIYTVKPGTGSLQLLAKGEVGVGEAE